MPNGPIKQKQVTKMCCPLEFAGNKPTITIFQDGFVAHTTTATVFPIRPWPLSTGGFQRMRPMPFSTGEKYDAPEGRHRQLASACCH